MGVESNTYVIPDLVLSDTFHEWFTVTNNSIINKLNRLKIYNVDTAGGSAGDGISGGVDSNGLLQIEIASTINKDITFNGNLTVNGSTTTINASEFTVDDYNIVLGATTETHSNKEIMDFSGNSAGGGIIINGSSGDKEFLWKFPNAAWNSNQNIALASGKSLLDEVRIATGASGAAGDNATKGLIFGFTAGTTGGADGSNALIRSFNTSIASGHSSDALYIDDDGYVSIVNGGNKITVEQTSHSLEFGNPVYMDTDGDYKKAVATSKQKAEVVGIVSRIYDVNKFEITMSGEVVGAFSAISDESATLTPGNAYFLSTTAGQITANKPVGTNQIQKTILIALASDRAIVKNYIGGEVNVIQDTSNSLRSNRIIALQEDHGFTYGDAVMISNSTDTLGKFIRCTAEVDGADVVGIVDNVNVGGVDDAVSIVLSGKFEFAAGDVPVDTNAGEVFYLNPDSTAVPNIISGSNIAFDLSQGQVNKPVFVSDGVSGGIITNWRGVVDDGGEVDEQVSDVPIGSVMAWSGDITDIPSGYVLCDGKHPGSGAPGGQYESLYNKIGIKYGTDGSGTDPESFRVPDLSSRFIVGYDQGTTDYGTLGNAGGEERHTLTIDEMPSHNHTTATIIRTGFDSTGGPSGYGQDTSQGAGPDLISNPTGGGQDHENRPPYLVLAWIIRAEGVDSLPDGTQILGGDMEYVPVLNYNFENYGELQNQLVWNPNDENDPAAVNNPDPGGWIHTEYGDGDALRSGPLNVAASKSFTTYNEAINSKNFVKFGYMRSIKSPSVIPQVVLQGEGDTITFPRAQRGNPSWNVEDGYKIWTLDKNRLVGNGLDASKIRSLEIQYDFDNDFLRGVIEYWNDDLQQWVRIYNSLNHGGPSMQDAGHHHHRVDAGQATIPVSPSQSEIKFRLYIGWYADWKSTPTQWEQGNYNRSYPKFQDAIILTVVGANQVVDNSLTRLRKSYTSRKNLLINGNFDIWQRQIGVNPDLRTNVDGNFHFADRWQRIQTVTTPTSFIRRRSFGLSQTDVPHYPQFYTQFQGYDSNATPASNGFSYVTQKIEDSRTLAGKNVTISFWAKGNSVGSIGIGYTRNYGRNDSTVENKLLKTVSLSSTQWKQYIVSFRMPDMPSSVTSRGNIGIGAGVFSDFLGINFITYAKTGAIGNGGADIKYTGTVDLAQVQVEEGSRATEFEILDYNTNLSLCQRYFSTSCDVLAGQTGESVGGNGRVHIDTHNVNTEVRGHIPFPVTMRARPTVKLFSHQDDVAGQPNKVNIERSYQNFNADDGSASNLFTDRIVAVNGAGTDPDDNTPTGDGIRVTQDYISSFFVIKNDGENYNNALVSFNYDADAEI